MAVTILLLHKHQCSFWTVVVHTSPGDTNSGTAWWLPARRRLTWHSPNGLEFAPGCWELLYRVLWMRHREPAEGVTLAGWMGAQAAVAVIAAGGGPHGNPEWLLLAPWATKAVTGRRGLAPCERTVNDKAFWISVPPLPSFLSLFWLTWMEQIQSHTPLCGSAIRRYWRQMNDNWERNQEHQRFINHICKPGHEFAMESEWWWNETVNISITWTNIEQDNLRQIRETTVLDRATLLGIVLSLRLWELDLRAPICTSCRCTSAQRQMTINLFDYGNIQEVRWNFTLSNIFTFDDNLCNGQLSAAMQIWVPAASRYRVQSRLPFNRPHQAALWQRLQCRLQCCLQRWLQCRIQYWIQCRIFDKLISPKILFRMVSRL